MPALNCNQTIILLDCYRGFNRKRHTQGQVLEELETLVSAGLIQKGKEQIEDGTFEYVLTQYGTTLADHLIDQATWQIVLSPGTKS